MRKKKKKEGFVLLGNENNNRQATTYNRSGIDERIQTINDLLPQYNCGACGFPGCAGFAEAIVEGEVEKLSDCKPGKDEHYNTILEYIKDHPNPDGSLIKVIK